MVGGCGKRLLPLTNVPVIMQRLFLQSLPLENVKVPQIQFIDRLLNFLLRHRDRFAQSDKVIDMLVLVVQTVQTQFLDQFEVMPVGVNCGGPEVAALGELSSSWTRLLTFPLLCMDTCPWWSRQRSSRTRMRTCPVLCTTGAWSRRAENCGGAAVAVREPLGKPVEIPQSQLLDVELSMHTVEVPQIQFIAGVCGQCCLATERQVRTVQTVQVGAGDSAYGGVYGVVAVTRIFSLISAAFFGLLRVGLGSGADAGSFSQVSGQWSCACEFI